MKNKSSEYKGLYDALPRIYGKMAFHDRRRKKNDLEIPAVYADIWGSILFCGMDKCLGRGAWIIWMTKRPGRKIP